MRELRKIINSYKVPSKTTKGVEYKVEIDMFGNIYCDCPAIKKICRHIRIIKNKMKGNYVKEDY